METQTRKDLATGIYGMRQHISPFSYKQGIIELNTQKHCSLKNLVLNHHLLDSIRRTEQETSKKSAETNNQ